MSEQLKLLFGSATKGVVVGVPYTTTPLWQPTPCLLLSCLPMTKFSIIYIFIFSFLRSSIGQYLVIQWKVYRIAVVVVYYALCTILGLLCFSKTSTHANSCSARSPIHIRTTQSYLYGAFSACEIMHNRSPTYQFVRDDP